jgi:hypothetical protein
MTEALTVEDILCLVNAEMTKINDVKLFYELKKRRCKHFGFSTSQYLKIVIALARLNLPINTWMVQTFSKTSDNLVLNALHRLGDKHLLVLKRVNKGQYEWVASDLLRQIMGSVKA